jgi:hypothetical protein
MKKRSGKENKSELTDPRTIREQRYLYMHVGREKKEEEKRKKKINS